MFAKFLYCKLFPLRSLQLRTTRCGEWQFRKKKIRIPIATHRQRHHHVASNPKPLALPTFALPSAATLITSAFCSDTDHHLLRRTIAQPLFCCHAAVAYHLSWQHDCTLWWLQIANLNSGSGGRKIFLCYKRAGESMMMPFSKPLKFAASD